MARKILLADDSVTAQNMGRRILTDAGYEVITVNNGSAAFKKIAEMLPELIVLDVYMPGYSGLEVCQRLKETRETANIPILLTVGKLEPFKPEEARRVRADAYLVKPFEASELLTALTRLEDKIVPRPAAQKGGQFAKAWAALEETSETKSGAKGEKFGDRETGWKDRLIIPSGTPKAEEPEEEVAPAAKKSKGSKKDEKSVPEIAIPGSVPPDITPEEVAAIAAAAAAFENKEQPAQAETVAKAEVPEMLSSLPVIAPEPEAAPVESKTETEVVVSEKEFPSAVSMTEVAAATSAVSEEKVEAKAESAVAAEPAAGKVEEISRKQDETVAVAAAAVSPEKVEQARVARWIAHEVPLEPSERGSILDEEMRAAGAVLQAATGGVDFSAATLLAKEPLAAAVVEAAASAAEPAPVETPAVAAAPVVEEIPAPVVEPVAAAEIPPAPETVEAVSAIVQEPSSTAKEDAAYAAAASASSAVVEATAPEVAASSSPIAETVPSLSEPEKAQPEAELAAAWAQWKEIRETVVGPQLTSKASDNAPAEVTDSQKVESENAAATPSNPTTISNMVDSMLAELKPKLMEEIAKKMAQEKKKD